MAGLTVSVVADSCKLMTYLFGTIWIDECEIANDDIVGLTTVDGNKCFNLGFII
jgi:hypothetical protein